MARVVRRPGSLSAERLRNIISNIDNKKLKVGWFQSARYDEGTPVAGVAAIQEFGSTSQRIPPRPFMRPVIAEKDEWISTLEIALRRVVTGQATETDALDIFGLLVSGQIRKKITEITEPPLSPTTLALRKQKLAGERIGRRRVMATAAAIAAGKTGPGELGDSSGINPKPLNFTGIMLNTLTHAVE